MSESQSQRPQYPDLNDPVWQMQLQPRKWPDPDFAVLKDETQGAPKGLLYHYTTVETFTRIINSNSLWASNVRFLNDSEEIKVGLDLLSEVLKERMTKAPQEGPLAEVYNALSHRIEVSRTIHSSPEEHSGFYVICFSNDGGDQLGQWRAYGAAGAGIAIGFNPKALPLLTPVNPNIARLVQVVYASQGARPLIDKFLDRLELVATSSTGSTGSAGEAALRQLPMFWKCGMLVDEVTAAVKHDAFREEQEWRVVVNPIPAGNAGLIQARASNGGVIPYLELQIRDFIRPLSWFLPIVDVVVGPSPRKDLNVAAINTLLRSKGYPAQARPSKVPFRP